MGQRKYKLYPSLAEVGLELPGVLRPTEDSRPSAA